MIGVGELVFVFEGAGVTPVKIVVGPSVVIDEGDGLVVGPAVGETVPPGVVSPVGEAVSSPVPPGVVPLDGTGVPW